MAAIVGENAWQLNPSFVQRRECNNKKALKMFNWLTNLFKKPVSTEDVRLAESFYAWGVDQARFRFPDRFKGPGAGGKQGQIARFEVIAPYVALTMWRARKESKLPLARTINETFMSDTDGALRELGTSDYVMRKEMQGYAGAFRARLTVCDEAFRTSDAAMLKEMFLRNQVLEEGTARIFAAELIGLAREAAQLPLARAFGDHNAWRKQKVA